MRHRLHKLLVCITGVCLVSTCTFANDQQSVIVAVGAQGTAEFGTQFNTWADRWENAAKTAEAKLTIIGRDKAASDRDTLLKALAEANNDSLEPLWLVLIGHGTFDGRIARFNLQGKDISADELAQTLADAKRPTAIINCSSCSSPFINALSGPNRTVVSATKDGGEIQFSRFGDAMSLAIGSLEADIDRDGQTSLLEAWLFAARRTAQFYESEGRLATEHSLLDDSGDGKGTRFEVFEGVRIRDSVENKAELDGQLSKRWHLVRSEAEKALTSEQRRDRDRLENQLEALRRRRSEYAEPEYLTELEEILLPLAQLYEEASKRPKEAVRN